MTTDLPRDVYASSESPEWYTPAWVAELARAVLGAIDLDPASSKEAQQTIGAERYYTAEHDGLAQPWAGRVYLNPPYGKTIGLWVDKLVAAYDAGEISAAVALLPARPDTRWFQPLYRFPLCFVRGRIRFDLPGGERTSGAPFPSVIVYMGPQVERFTALFGERGQIQIPNALAAPAPAELVSAPEISPAILAGQLAPSSIAKYTQDFGAYTDYAAGAGLAATDASTLARWRAHLAEETRYSPHTINRMLAAVKRVIAEAAQQGYTSHEIAAAFARVKGVKPRALRGRLKEHARTRISPADMRRICDTPDAQTLVGLRDRALLATLASSGLRESEAASLTVGQIEKRGKGYIVSVRGKTDETPRDAPLSAEAYSYILAWLDKRPIMTQTIFTSFAGRGGRANDKPMSAVSVWRVVEGYARACGLAHVKPHDFRRFVGTQLAATDIRKAQKALGHKRIDTTARHYVLDELEPGLTDGLY